MMSGPLKLKDAMLVWMTYALKTQCTIYSVVHIFRLVKVIQKNALCRENVEEIQLQKKKECFSKSLNISILIRQAVWKKNWVVIMFYIWFKQIHFADPPPYRHGNADYVTTNKWLFQQKIPRPESFAFTVVLVFKL